MRKLVDDGGLGPRFLIESAGVSGEHAGESADPRSRAAAARRGYVLDGRARQFVYEDFERFDLVLAADRENLRRLERLAQRTPPGTRNPSLSLLREYDPAAALDLDVPDPWAQGPAAFVRVLEVCERSCAGLLAALTVRLGITATRSSGPR